MPYEFISENLKLVGNNSLYLATTENDQPRVHPFRAVAEWDGKTYICTNNQKKVFSQILKNPKVEISGMVGINGFASPESWLWTQGWKHEKLCWRLLSVQSNHENWHSRSPGRKTKG